MKNWKETVRKAIETNLFILLESSGDGWRQSVYRDNLKARIQSAVS